MRKKRWQRVVAVLASITVFCTTYALILPAITMEEPTYCGFEEHVEHKDECYSEKETLICTLPEGESHIHDESCLNEDGEYICGLSEGKGAHQHDDSCREITTELMCELPIHEHTLQCFSNPDADVENSSIWERTLSENTGRYGDDVLSVAKSQLSYKESTRNYLVQEDGVTQNGYTRYGEWFGDPYGDWNCMFTSFCIYYAGVPGSVVPTASNVNEWIASVGGNELYKTNTEEIAAGDIAFLDSDWDGVADVSAVVAAVKDEDISVIQGDVDGVVAKLSYGKDQVSGYLDLTEEPSELAETELIEEDLISTEEPDLIEDDPAITEKTDLTDEEPTDAEEVNLIDDVILHATASDGAEVLVSGHIPEGAEVTIIPVVLSEKEFSGYIGDDAGISVQQYVAYDITIFVDGVEWQPDETVSVTISKPAIQIDKKDNFEVAHIDSAGNAENVNAEITSDGNVQFDTDGFSLYIIYTYTVDFHYSDFTYSIQGGDSILLSELFEALGIDVDMANVVNVEFSDETLIRLEKLSYDDGSFDWRLFSLKAFSTDEELTVTLDNQEILRIHVTDAPGGDNSGTPDPVPAPDYIGSYPTGSGSTQWQITKEEYTGREQSNKIPVDSDGGGKTDVYLQKNVVPTDVENEFLVYLSVDKRVTWEEFLNHSRIGISTTGKYKTVGEIIPGGVTEGNITQELLESGAQGSYTRRYYIKFNVYQNHNSTTPLYSYYDWRYGNTSNCSNATVFLRIPGVGDLVVGAQTTLHFDGNGTGNPFVLSIYLDSVATDLSFQKTVFKSVTDELGDQVEFMSFGSMDGTASYDDDTRTITWLPSDNPTLVPDLNYNPITGWNENIIQLVYRVRLNVMDDDFVSCADTIGSKSDSIANGESFKVNNSAVLDYDKIALPGTSGVTSQYGLEAEFPIPEVRGLLYDITFIKLNEEGRQLAGAVFALYQSNGTTPVLDSSGNPMTVTTTATGISRFPVLPQSDNPGLPYGDYVLKEIQAPPHYTTPTQNSWSVKLCYTNAKTLLAPDASPYQHNMRYTGNDTNGQWRITNPRKPFYYAVEVIKVDESGNPLPGAGFSVADPVNAGQTLTGETDTYGKYLFDANFTANIAYVLSEAAPPDGYFSLPANIQFRVDEDTSDDTYTAVFINSGDFAGTVSLNLKETGTGDNTKYVLEVTVKNQAIYELPATGGPGTLIYTLSGILLLGTALMVGFCTRRKREGRAAR